jgi:hypothetical protein
MKGRNQCCGSGSARIRNFLLDPELEVLDPDPEFDFNLNISHKKIAI